MREPKVFSDSYQFTICLFGRTKSFPRSLRPTLGRKMEELSLEMTQNLRRALMTPVKASKGSGPSLRLRLLKTASDHLDDLRVLMDLSRDLQVLPVAAFEELTKLSRQIGREIGGLIKHADGEA
ncbi:four helix bundle protein [Bdellovibrio sp.]|uniref:four helix bundle protein n=1 Tax=Bdellovibrio sp. TaxID=28201 RepID=UPI0039E6A7AB